MAFWAAGHFALPKVNPSLTEPGHSSTLWLADVKSKTQCLILVDLVKSCLELHNYELVVQTMQPRTLSANRSFRCFNQGDRVVMFIGLFPLLRHSLAEQAPAIIIFFCFHISHCLVSLSSMHAAFIPFCRYSKIHIP